MAHLWQPEDKLQESVLSFQHVLRVKPRSSGLLTSTLTSCVVSLTPVMSFKALLSSSLLALNSLCTQE